MHNSISLWCHLNTHEAAFHWCQPLVRLGQDCIVGSNWQILTMFSGKDLAYHLRTFHLNMSGAEAGPFCMQSSCFIMKLYPLPAWKSSLLFNHVYRYLVTQCTIYLDKTQYGFTICLEYLVRLCCSIFVLMILSTIILPSRQCWCLFDLSKLVHASWNFNSKDSQVPHWELHDARHDATLLSSWWNQSG